MNKFEYPEMFWLLILPFFFYIILPKVKGLHGDAIRVPFIDDIKNIKSSVKNKYYSPIGKSVLFSIKFVYLFILWILLVIASARPQYVGEPFRLKTDNRDIMMVIDISTSMLQPDFHLSGRSIDRLSAVKLVVSILLNADAGMAGNSTSIGDALGLALKNIKNEKDKKNKVIILLTDGEHNDGALSMAEAIDLAQKEGIKIYTIGVGADESFFGGLIKFARSGLDEASLREIADKTKGTYFRAKDLSSLREVYKNINQLEPQNNEGNIIQEKKELFYIPLALALILSVFLLFIPRSYLK